MPNYFKSTSTSAFLIVCGDPTEMSLVVKVKGQSYSPS